MGCTARRSDSERSCVAWWGIRWVYAVPNRIAGDDFTVVHSPLAAFRVDPAQRTELRAALRAGCEASIDSLRFYFLTAKRSVSLAGMGDSSNHALVARRGRAWIRPCRLDRAAGLHGALHLQTELDAGGFVPWTLIRSTVSRRLSQIGR